jgi:HlyD family secretion protein
MNRTKEKRSVGWFVLLALVVIIAGLLILRWSVSSDVMVAASTVTIGDIRDTVSTVGTAIPVNEFTARASYPAAVEKIHVELGQHVEKGQLLIDMKDPFANSRVAAATANLESTEVDSENVHHNGSQEDRINFVSDIDRARAEESAASGSLTTLEKLQATGDASPAEIAAARDRRRAAEDTLRAVQDRMSRRYSVADQKSWDDRVLQSKAALNAERSNLSNIHITSPIAGTVYLILVAQYDFVPSGADLINVANMNKMKVNARFDEPDIGKLRDGQLVTIAWDGKPGHLWHGHIEHAPMAVVAQGQRNVGECTISVDDAREDLPAHTGVTVTVLLRQQRHVLTIPHEALQQDPTGFYVYRIVNDELVRTPVDIGIVSVPTIEITRGLAAGDRVALHLMSEKPMSNHLRVQVAE